MGELLVRGRAEARLRPTQAVLEIGAMGRDPSSQAAALARAAEVCAVVDAAVERGRQGPDALIRSAETSSIRTAEEWEHGQQGQRRRVGWTAERGTRVECAPDAAGLTTLVSALAHDGIRLSGPRWNVAADAPGWDALRTAAVVDARRRADAYAARVEGHVGAVRWIAEPGLRRDPDAVTADFREARAAGFALGDQEPGEPLAVRIAVEPVAVDVTVEVAFDLT
jgi:uncharacterized protein YggE